MRKWIAIIAAAAMTAALAAGCGSSGSGQVDVKDTKVMAAEVTAASEGDTLTVEERMMLDDSDLGKSNLKIALITTGKGVKDHAVNSSVKEGLDEFLLSDETASAKVFNIESGDAKECVKKAEELAQKYEVVIVSGEGLGDISKVAKKYKKVKFIVIDSATEELDNVTSILFRDEECGFLAGVTAALETKTGKVAAVGSEDSQIGRNGKLGFTCGVNYANKNLGTKVENLTSDSNTTVKKLIKAGCDIVYPASPELETGAFKAVKDAENVRVIGSFKDQFDFGGNSKINVVATSVYRTQNYEVINELMAIAMDNYAGENKVVGASSYSINYIFDEERCTLSETTLTELDKVFEKLRDGEIVPASISNGSSSDGFTGL